MAAALTYEDRAVLEIPMQEYFPFLAAALKELNKRRLGQSRIR